MRKTRQTKKAPINGYVLAALISVLVWFGVFIPKSSDNGTSRFDGEEKTAAQQALRQTKEHYSTGNETVTAFGTLQYRVDAVRKDAVPATGIYAACKAFYSVDVSRIGLFGTVGATDTTLVCLK